MIPTTDLNTNDLQLLKVNNTLIVPTSTHVHVIITAANVLHY